MGEAVAIGVRRVAWLVWPRLVWPGLVWLGVAAGLSACQNAPSRAMPCPEVKVVPDAGYVTRFAGDSEDLTDTDYEAKIVNVDSQCFYVTNTDTKKQSIRSELQVQIAASRGPKNKGDKADIKYYVKLTGPGGAMLKSQDFELEIPLPQNQPTAAVLDDPQVIIPLADGQSGDHFRIWVHFDVSEKELAYNRRNPQQ
jgi:hypothetical protein